MSISRPFNQKKVRSHSILQWKYLHIPLRQVSFRDKCANLFEDTRVSRDNYYYNTTY